MIQVPLRLCMKKLVRCWAHVDFDRSNVCEVVFLNDATKDPLFVAEHHYNSMIE